MIPRRVFQTVALLAVIFCLFVSLGYAYYGGPPFPAIAALSGTKTLSALVAVMVGLLLSLPIIVPLRMLSDMKPLTEDFAQLSPGKLGPAVAAEKQKLAAMKRGSPGERRRYHLRLAAASPICLLIGVPILLATYELDGHLFALPIALAIYGVFGPPVHLAMAWWVGRER